MLNEPMAYQVFTFNSCLSKSNAKSAVNFMLSKDEAQNTTQATLARFCPRQCLLWFIPLKRIAKWQTSCNVSLGFTNP